MKLEHFKWYFSTALSANLSAVYSSSLLLSVCGSVDGLGRSVNEGSTIGIPTLSTCWSALGQDADPQVAHSEPGSERLAMAAAAHWCTSAWMGVWEDIVKSFGLAWRCFRLCHCWYFYGNKLINNNNFFIAAFCRGWGPHSPAGPCRDLRSLVICRVLMVRLNQKIGHELSCNNWI